MTFRDRAKKGLRPLKPQLFSAEACEPGFHRNKLRGFTVCRDRGPISRLLSVRHGPRQPIGSGLPGNSKTGLPSAPRLAVRREASVRCGLAHRAGVSRSSLSLLPEFESRYELYALKASIEIKLIPAGAIPARRTQIVRAFSKIS